MDRAVEMMQLVGIPSPEQRVRDYPHQLSGGMRQRVMIAMALSCNPKLLIADEPTTALDVTVQAQILELMKELRERLGMAILLITHDLGVVAEMVDEVAVMYAGRIVERGPVADIFASPQHPYTEALLDSIPLLGMRYSQPLKAIRGVVPSPLEWPAGLPLRAPLRLRLRQVPGGGPAAPARAAAGVCVLAVRERPPRSPDGAPRRSHERRPEHDAARPRHRRRAGGRPAEGARSEEALPRPYGAAAADRRSAPGGRRRRPRRLPGRDGRPRRGVRLRQVDPRPHADPAARADRGRDRVRRRRRAAPRQLRPEGDAPAHADRLPGLRRLARPAHEGEGPRRRGPADPRARAQAARRGRDRGARARRPQRRGGRALPAPVQRRPAPADRPRPRPRAAPEVHRRGRAGVRARRLDPVAGAQPPRRAEAGVQPDVPLRRARPRRRRLHLRPRRGHVPRQDRRAGDLRRALPPAAAPVHDGPPLGEPGAGPRPQAPAGRAPRRRAEPDQPAVRLPLPDPLPDRAGRSAPRWSRCSRTTARATAPRATSPGSRCPRRRR